MASREEYKDAEGNIPQTGFYRNKDNPSATLDFVFWDSEDGKLYVESDSRRTRVVWDRRELGQSFFKSYTRVSKSSVEAELRRLGETIMFYNLHLPRVHS